MVARGPAPGRITHTRFRSIAEHLEPGDLSWSTPRPRLPPRSTGPGGSTAARSPSTSPARQAPTGWIVELRDERLGRVGDAAAGERIDAASRRHRSPWRAPGPTPSQRSGSRLWEAEIAVESGVVSYLQREGRPITYDHIRGRWPLSDYQTIFAEHPGSAEMASASRPFSPRWSETLEGAGSRSLRCCCTPASPRWRPTSFRCPSATRCRPRRRAGSTRPRAAGGRIIAAGTTVDPGAGNRCGAGRFGPCGAGITDLVIGPDRPPRVVTGLITGWHEPEASHLLMLEAVAGRETRRSRLRRSARPAKRRLPLARVRRLVPAAALSASNKQSGVTRSPEFFATTSIPVYRLDITLLVVRKTDTGPFGDTGLLVAQDASPG